MKPMGKPNLKVGLLAAALSTALVGCGGSSNDYDDEQPTVQTGIFIDSAVAGLEYRTATQSGHTNANGEFDYVEGETVTFFIGGLEFPAVVATGVVTPLDLANSNNPYDPAANNIARLLQSLDSDNDPENGITIEQAARTAAEGKSLSDWSDSDAFAALFSSTFPEETLVEVQAAAEHLQGSLNELNEQASLTLIGRFNEGQELDEGLAEIVAFHEASESIMVINASASTVDILGASGLTSDALENPLSSSNLTRRSQLNVASDVDADDALSDFETGGINSVAVNGNLMAVAVEHDTKQNNGVIAFYTVNAEGSATYLKSVVAGALPDNVQISTDGAYVVAANEGEPSKDYQTDPEGSVTLIAVTEGVPADTATQITFTAFNEGQARASEIEGVRISHPDATVAQDLEPEYVAFSDDNTKAFVSMQENNAIAVIDLATATIDSIFGLGYKDHSVAGNGLDASNRDDCSQEDINEGDCSELNDGINIRTWDNLRGLYMPDSIVSFSQNGTNYVMTANEGDSREYIYDAEEGACTAAGHDFDEEEGCISWIDETRAGKLDLDATVFTDESVQENENLGRIKAINTEGDIDSDGEHEVIYSFGTRSFSIFNADTGALVSDSGDAFERITATVLGTDGFNSTDDENDFDDRSDDKGPEPEALAVGTVGDKTYAFIGLERVGGIMMYDVTNPAAPAFVEYSINRDFSVDIEENLANAGDLAPEGMKFVAADKSPTGNALLIVGNEVSGTTTVYEVK